MSWLSRLFRPRELDNPAGSSGYSRLEVRAEASTWAARSPSRSWVEVAATGSMVPTIDSGSILLLEKVTGTDLRVGDIAIYQSADGKSTICHRVRDVSKSGAVLFTGDNNRGTSPDGWIDSRRILWRVAGILYTKR